MKLKIEIPDDVGAALTLQAESQGVSVAQVARQLVEKAFAPAIKQERSDRPLETGWGMWARYGPAPSAEEIDENRRDMFR